MKYMSFTRAFWWSTLLTTLPFTVLLCIADQGKKGNFVDSITNNPLIFLAIAGAWGSYMAMVICNVFNNNR